MRSIRFNWIAVFLIHLGFGSYLENAQGQSLIAHRGGVVDSSYTENGLAALKLAVRDGYRMVETDMRVTRDGVLIANHDPDFQRYYGINKKVSDLDWAEIRKLKSTLDGNTPLQLEEVLRFCQANKLGVMLDNKIAGMDSLLFGRLIGLLDKYDLRGSALMIGTDESTDYFTGKIKLSCSRKQLEENMKKPGYHASHYFLFERPAALTREDVKWATTHNILTVAAINKFHYRKSQNMIADAGNDCKHMQEIGVKNFQIDSEFRKFFVSH